MHKSCTLKVKRFPEEYGMEEEIYDLEAAQYRLFGVEETPCMVVVEGQAVHSYQDLCRLASQHADKEFLTVFIVSPMEGGTLLSSGPG